MGVLIDQLFPESQANAIRKLWEDKSAHLLLEQEIGKQLVSYNGIVDELPFTQLMLITSLSSFAYSADECHDVASIIYWGLKKKDILPMVTEYQSPREYAYKCLISLGLFKQALIARWKRHAYPSPTYYRKGGVASFKQIGMDAISGHFVQWEGFMGEFFV